MCYVKLHAIKVLIEGETSKPFLSNAKMQISFAQEFKSAQPFEGHVGLYIILYIALLQFTSICLLRGVMDVRY